METDILKSLINVNQTQLISCQNKCLIIYFVTRIEAIALLSVMLRFRVAYQEIVSKSESSRFRAHSDVIRCARIYLRAFRSVHNETHVFQPLDLDSR